MKTSILTMTKRRHEATFSHLFPGDGLEAAAILVCNQGTGRLHHRLIVADVLFPPHHLSTRKRGYVSWPFGNCLPPEKISELDLSGQSIVTIHSHPNGSAQFSRVDNRNDRALFPSVCNWFDDERPNGSAIMLQDGTVTARTVDAHGKFSNMPTVAAVGENIRIWKSGSTRKETAYQEKQAQTFGTGTLDLK